MSNSAPEPIPSPDVMILAQGVAGDRIAAVVARSLRDRFPNATMRGSGGARMEAEGVEIVGRTENLSAMGWVAVLNLYRRIRAAATAVVRSAEARPPDLVVCVDIWRPLQVLMKESPVLRAAPKVCVQPPAPDLLGHSPLHDRVAGAFQAIVTPFPHQADLFRQLGAQVQPVRHPLLDYCYPPAPWEERSGTLLLPGSRVMEVRHNLPYQLDIWQSFREAAGLGGLTIGSANELCRRMIEEICRGRGIQPELVDDSRKAMASARFGLVTSGTATLEAAASGLPHAAVYQGNWLMHVEYRLWLRRRRNTERRGIPVSNFVALPNILANRAVVPEVLGLVLPQAREICVALASEPERLRQMSADLQQVIAELPQLSAGEAVARAAADILQSGGTAAG